MILALAVLLPGPAQARRLTIGMPFLTSGAKFPKVEAFFREAYRRVGAEVDFVTLPSLLELDFADSGRTDGSMLRTELVASRHKNLVRVPCPLLLVDFVACTEREDVKIDRPADLTGYRIGISRGNLTTRLICQDAGVEPVLLNTLTSGVRMMEEGRLDAILEERNTMEMVMAQAGWSLHCSAPLHQGYLYHWLNKRNADLAGPLAEAFKAMIAEGGPGRIFGKGAAHTTK